MDKAQGERQHARRRAEERYDIDYNRHARRDIIAAIQKNKGILVKRQSQRVTLWYVEYNGEYVKVAYDRNRKEIITFLPVWKDELERCSKKNPPTSPEPPPEIEEARINRRIIQMIEGRHVDAILVERRPDGNSVWYARSKCQDVKVVYDRKHQTILEFLPPDPQERQRCALRRAAGS